MAPGPGNWVTIADIAIFKRLGICPVEVPFLDDVATAAKLRVINDLGATKVDCYARRARRQYTDALHLRADKLDWLDKGPVLTLVRAKDAAAARQVTHAKIVAACPQPSHAGNRPPRKLPYQKTAVRLLFQSHPGCLAPELRIRQKLELWQQSVPVSIASRRVLRHWLAAHKLVLPAARAAHFKLFWNGWCTSRRLLHINRPCPFGCRHGCDDAPHYLVCDTLWDFLAAPRPLGAGLSPAVGQRRETTLLTADRLSENEVARIIAGVYGFYRLLISVSTGKADNLAKPRVSILLTAKQALSRAGRRLFEPDIDFRHDDSLHPSAPDTHDHDPHSSQPDLPRGPGNVDVHPLFD